MDRPRNSNDEVFNREISRGSSSNISNGVTVTFEGNNLELMTAVYLFCDEITKYSKCDSYIKGKALEICKLLENVKLQHDFSQDLNINDFEILKKLGSGSYGEVFHAKNKLKNEFCALKVMEKSKLYQEGTMKINYRDEAYILSKNDSPWLMKTHEIFQNHDYLYFSLEYCDGGDLLDVLCEYDGRIPEKIAKSYLIHMINAVDALHHFGYIHRDIKPENFIINNKGLLVLTDFNTAIIKGTINAMERQVLGTPDYIAPEVLQSMKLPNSFYNECCDWWSLGVTYYEVIFGDTPFFDESIDKTYKNIMEYKSTLYFPDEDDICTEVIEFIRSILTEADSRLGRNEISDFVTCNYLQNENWNSKLNPLIIDRITSDNCDINILELSPKVPASDSEPSLLKHLYFVGLDYDKKILNKNSSITKGTVTNRNRHKKRFGSSKGNSFINFFRSKSFIYDEKNSFETTPIMYAQKIRIAKKKGLDLKKRETMKIVRRCENKRRKSFMQQSYATPDVHTRTFQKNMNTNIYPMNYYVSSGSDENDDLPITDNDTQIENKVISSKDDQVKTRLIYNSQVSKQKSISMQNIDEHEIILKTKESHYFPAPIMIKFLIKLKSRWIKCYFQFKKSKLLFFSTLINDVLVYCIDLRYDINISVKCIKVNKPGSQEKEMLLEVTENFLNSKFYMRGQSQNITEDLFVFVQQFIKHAGNIEKPFSLQSQAIKNIQNDMHHYTYLNFVGENVIMIKKERFKIYNLNNKTSSRFSLIYHPECVNVIEEINIIILISNARSLFIKGKKRLLLLTLDYTTKQYKVIQPLPGLVHRLRDLVVCKSENTTERRNLSTNETVYDANGVFLDGNKLSYFTYNIQNTQFSIKNTIETPENMKLITIIKSTVFGTSGEYLMLWLFKIINEECSVIKTQLKLIHNDNLIHVHEYLTYFCLVTQNHMRLLNYENASTFVITSTNSVCYESFVQNDKLILFCRHGIDIYSGESLQWIQNIHLSKEHLERENIFSDCFIFQDQVLMFKANEKYASYENNSSKDDKQRSRAHTSVLRNKFTRKTILRKS